MKPKLDLVNQKFQSIHGPGFPDNAAIMVTTVYDLLRFQRNLYLACISWPPSISWADAFVRSRRRPLVLDPLEQSERRMGCAAHLQLYPRARATGDFAKADVGAATRSPLPRRNGGGGRKPDSDRMCGQTYVAPPHDARLPIAGSLLVKDFKDGTIVVKVLDEGFEYDGRRFTSLSAIAQEITGTKWNGYRFFGLLKENASAR